MRPIRLQLLPCWLTSCLLLLCISQHLHGQAAQEDSLLYQINAQPLAEQADRYVALTRLFWQKDAQRSQRYGERAILLADSIQDLSLQLEAHRAIGGLYYYQGKLDKSLWHNNLAYTIASGLQDVAREGSQLNNLGIIYRDQGDYRRSMQMHSQSVRIAELNGMNQLLTVSYNNLGRLYMELKDYDRASSYLYQGLSKLPGLSANEGLRLALYGNLARLYASQNRTDSTEYYLHNMLDLSMRSNNINRQAEAYQGLGILRLKQERYDSARYYLEESVRLNKAYEDTRGLSEDLFQLARLCYAQGLYQQMYDCLNRSIKAARQSNSLDILRENYKLFARYYEAVGRPADAYSYMQRYLVLEDSLFNEQLAHELTTIRMEQMEERTSEMMRTKDEQLAQKQSENFFLWIVIMLGGGLIILIIFSYANNRKATQQLKSQNAEIQSQKEKIESQKEYLERSNQQLAEARKVIINQNERLHDQNESLERAVKDRSEKLGVATREMDHFLYRLSHDIRGPLSRMMGLVQVAHLDIKDQEAINYFELVGESAAILNKILVRLQMVNEIKHKSAQPEQIHFEELINGQLQVLSTTEGFDQMHFDVIIDESLTFTGDLRGFEIIFYNLLENAIQFRDTNRLGEGLVLIRVNRSKTDRLTIDFQDSGVGIPSDQRAKIFEMFNKSSKVGSGIGLGLYLTKIAVESMGGNISLQENDTNFTHFHIEI